MQLLHTDNDLGFQIKYLSRAEWGSLASTEAFIKSRFTAPAPAKICYQIHHTAGIDADDTTPNMIDLSEAITYMRKLQWSRPDLGALPYSENAAISEDLETVWIFEGRGFSAVGAHTADHNFHGHALGWQGNFDLWTPERALSLAVATIQWRFNYLRTNGFPNLGSERSPKGWLVHGHRDSANKSCPGSLLYPQLSLVRLVNEEDDVKENIEAMKQFGTAFWVRCRAVTGQPGGDASYWGENRASQAEWVAAYPILYPAALRTMAAGSVTVGLNRGDTVRLA